MIRHRLRTTLALLITAAVSVGWSLTAATPAAANATKQLAVQQGTVRLTLTVPSSWHVSASSPTPQCGCGGDYNPVCIVASGDYDLNPNNCVLVIGGNWGSAQPDEPVPGYRLPKCADWTTTYEAHGHVGVRPGEYRIFLDRCHDRKSEQWTSLTTPSVSIWHPLSWGADDASAAYAVQTAVVAGHDITQGRTSDMGYVRRMFRRDGHIYVAIDRVVMSLSGHLMNHDPATYVHRLSWRKGSTNCPHFLSNCSPAELLAQFHKGAQPADGTRPLAGRAVAVYRYHGWSMNDLERWAFASTGDSGHCGCG